MAQFALAFPHFAVMVAVPTHCPVTRPSSLTMAMDSAEDDQLTVLSLSGLFDVTVAVSCTVSPISILALLGATVIWILSAGETSGFSSSGAGLQAAARRRARIAIVLL